MEVKFQSAKEFNFEEDISIKTTRLKSIDTVNNETIKNYLENREYSTKHGTLTK